MAPDLLPCGADRTQVVDAVLDDRVEAVGHGPGCPHCDATRDRTRARWAAVRASIATAEEPPPSVARAVFARVQAARTGDQVPLPSRGPGRTFVASAALADLARRVARPVVGVAGVHDVVVAHRPEGGLVLTVAIAADLAPSRPLPDVAEAVRHAVSEAVAGAAGTPVTRIDVAIS